MKVCWASETCWLLCDHLTGLSFCRALILSTSSPCKGRAEEFLVQNFFTHAHSPSLMSYEMKSLFSWQSSTDSFRFSIELSADRANHDSNYSPFNGNRTKFNVYSQLRWKYSGLWNPNSVKMFHLWPTRDSWDLSSSWTRSIRGGFSWKLIL